MRRAEVGVLALAVLTRGALGWLRFVGSPERFLNREEAHNATAAWLFGHGELLHEILRVQYRSFSAGCTVVSLVAAPFLAGTDALWAWKLVALLWTAAIQVAGFAALRAVANAPAGWAWLLLSVIPPVGGLDLSLMLWGNHQESALFVLLGLLAHARGRPFALGLSLGFGFAFARTSAYAGVVLLPLALAGGRTAAGWVSAGFALGVAPLLLPAAGGDAGWYRFSEALVPTLDRVGERAATLFGPDALASRAWLPLRHPWALGAAWMSAGAVGAALLLGWRRCRVLVALAAAWSLAYCFTSFPIFVVSARAPVNNIRYHAPWLLLLGLLLSASLGVAWERGWKRSAGLALIALLLSNAWALARSLSPPGTRWRELSAIDAAGFVTTVAARFPEAAPLAGTPEGGERPARVVSRLWGITLARTGEPLPTFPLREEVLSGFGEAAVEPCAASFAVERALRAVPEAQRGAVGRGMGLTLSFCPRPPREAAALDRVLVSELDCAACSLGARQLLDGCLANGDAAPGGVGACVQEALREEPGPRAMELAFGVGRAWADPLRTPAELEAFLAAFASTGALRGALEAGLDDIAAGSRQPALARDREGAPR